MALKKHSKGAKAYDEIDIKNGKFIPRDRKDDSKFEGLKYFSGKDGNLIEVIETKGDKIKLSFHTGFKETKEKDAKGKEITKEISEKRTPPKWYGLEIFYQEHERLECEPKKTEKPIEPEKEIPMPSKGTHGFMKHILSGYSLSELIGGGKQLIDFVKHKLDHHSKMNAAELALAMGKRLGFNDDWLTDLR